MNNASQIDTIQTALNALTWARAAGDAMAEVRAESRLLDTCVALGMDMDEPVIEEWAAIHINNLYGNL